MLHWRYFVFSRICCNSALGVHWVIALLSFIVRYIVKLHDSHLSVTESSYLSAFSFHCCLLALPSFAVRLCYIVTQHSTALCRYYAFYNVMSCVCETVCCNCILPSESFSRYQAFWSIAIGAIYMGLLLLLLYSGLALFWNFWKCRGIWLKSGKRSKVRER